MIFQECTKIVQKIYYTKYDPDISEIYKQQNVKKMATVSYKLMLPCLCNNFIYRLHVFVTESRKHAVIIRNRANTGPLRPELARFLCITVHRECMQSYHYGRLHLQLC